MVAEGDKHYSLGCSRFGETPGLSKPIAGSLKGSNINVRKSLFVAFSDGFYGVRNLGFRSQSLASPQAILFVTFGDRKLSAKWT